MIHRAPGRQPLVASLIPRLLLCLVCAVTAGSVVSAARAEAPPSPDLTQLSGPIQVGYYDPLDLAAQTKLWFMRFTSPAVLVNTDVAFVYDRVAFCGLVNRPSMQMFYTPRFAIARKDAARYEVGEALQINKVDFCKSGTDGKSEFAVISKDRLGSAAPMFLINWASKGSIAGVAAVSMTPKSDFVPSETPNSPLVSEFNQKALDRDYLRRFANSLSASGVKLNVANAVGPFRPDENIQALVAASITSPASSAKSANNRQGYGRYCLKDLETRQTECKDSFEKLAEKISLRIKPLKSLPARADRAANPDNTVVRARYQLDVMN